MLQSFAAGRWKGNFHFPSADDPPVWGFGGSGQNSIVSGGMGRNAPGVDGVREQVLESRCVSSSVTSESVRNQGSHVGKGLDWFGVPSSPMSVRLPVGSGAP